MRNVEGGRAQDEVRGAEADGGMCEEGDAKGGGGKERSGALREEAVQEVGAYPEETDRKDEGGERG